MPLFYFDIVFDSREHRDAVGSSFPDLKSAEEAALASLPERARTLLPQGSAGAVTVFVRDEHGQVLTSATVTTRVKRFDP